MKKTTTVRQVVATATRSAHERLHDHPVIGRLIAPTLTIHDYMRALEGFHRVYQPVEEHRRRLGIWTEFTLADQCNALETDCGSVGNHPEMKSLELASPAHMLGVLYALHGAKFGATQIRRNLSVCLPDAPKAYFSIRMRPELWKNLLAEMDQFCEETSDQSELIQGALDAFNSIHLSGSVDSMLLS